jgi:predicted DNA-binding transcriptional regulator AlpA
VDVERAAELYAKGWSLSQIGAELGVRWNVVHDHLRRAGGTMRPVGAPTHPASTEVILDLRDQGLTWTEVAKRVDMTVSGTWSRYRKARPPKPQRLGRWQQVFAEALGQKLAVGVRAAVIDHLGRVPTRAELNAARRAAHSFASTGRARVLYVPGADDASGDRSYLVLARPNVIMNDIRLRGLGVAGTHAAGRKSPHNHAQAVRNFRRALRNAAGGARLIQADGLDNESAAGLAAGLADTLAELHRLERRLNRRVNRDADHRPGMSPGSVGLSHST